MAHLVSEMRTKMPKADMKLKHRHSGSASNILMTAEDFGGPGSGGSSMSASLKEKRMKRRTRSSLGGTEDFIKELDFLVPSPTKKGPDSNTPKELPKPSPKTQVAEKKQFPGVETLAYADEAVEDLHASAGSTPLTERKVPASESTLNLASDGLVNGALYEAESKPIVDSNGLENGATQDGGSKTVMEDSGFVKGLTHAIKSLVGLTEGNVRSNDAGQPAGDLHQLDSLGSVGLASCPNNLHSGVEEVQEDVSLTKSINGTQEGKSPVLSSPASLPESGVKEVGQKNHIQAPGEESVLSISELKRAPESLPSSTGSGDSLSKSQEQKSTKLATAEAGVSSVSNVQPLSHVVSEGVKERKGEKKVSVQKRIEELERKAGAKPVHFRSQSLNLVRTFEFLGCEEDYGNKLPLRQPPVVADFLPERGSSTTIRSPDQELPCKPIEGMVMGLTESTEQGKSAVDPIHKDEVHQGKVETPTVNLVSELRLESEKDPGTVPNLSEDCNNENISHDSKLNGVHNNMEELDLDKDMIGEGLQMANNVDGKEQTRGESEELVEGSSAMPLQEQGLVDMEDEDKLLDAELLDAANPESSERRETEVLLCPGEDTTTPAPKHGVTVVEMEEERLDPKPESSDAVETPVELGLGEGHTIVSGDGVHQDLVPSAVSENQSANEGGNAIPEGGLSATPESCTLPAVANSVVEPTYRGDEKSFLSSKEEALDPLFAESQQDRLWEVLSQELSLADESNGQEVRECSAQEEDGGRFASGTSKVSDAAIASSSTGKGSSQSSRGSKVDRLHTPLRSLLAEEGASEKVPGPERSGVPQKRSSSPGSSLFRRIVSAGKNSPTTQSSKFSPKNQTSARPFLSSCICCSPVK